MTRRTRTSVLWRVVVAGVALLSVLLAFVVMRPAAGRAEASSQVAPSVPPCPEKPGFTQPCPAVPAGASPVAVPFQVIGAEFTPSPQPPGLVNAPSPLPGAEFLPQNAWWSPVGSEAITAWAGAVTGDPPQGVVVVMSQPLNDPTQTGPTTLHEYVTPTRDGSVRIVSAQGTTLTLVAADGTTFAFDAATGLYA